MTALRITDLRAAYGAAPVLRGVNLELTRDQLLAVLGPSGCGKTTLLRVLAGFMPAQSGLIELRERVLTGPGRNIPPERRRISIVPQEGALFPHLSVEDNVGFGLRQAADRTSRVSAMLDLVGMTAEARRYPSELSGGQQQRIALARALAPRPDFVLLDEPFSALDAHLREHLRKEVKDILRAESATAILVTHDQQEALSVADQIAVMREGVICQQGSPRDVYERPANRWIGEFIGDSVVLDATFGHKVAHTALGELDLTDVPAGQSRVLIRPEQIRFDPAGVLLTVVRSEYFGHDATVHGVLADGTRISARTPVLGSFPAAGDQHRVSVAGPVHPV
ncbi:MAG: ABC transporter ATP-binding protein [Aeromicrobium sp.]